MIQKYFKVVLCAVTLIVMSACSSDSNEEEPYLFFNNSPIQIGSNGGIRGLTITSNIQWRAYENCEWLQLSSDSGTGNGTLNIHVSPNTSSNSRSTEITIMSRSGSYNYSLYIIQDGNNDNPGGGNTQQKPSAPTGVTVSNEGNNYTPDVRVRWNAVSNATTYYIYKSSSANGAYSKIGESSYTVYSDSNAPTNGASAYYKVKAVNNAGESTFSDYAKYTSTNNTQQKPSAPTGVTVSNEGNNYIPDVRVRWNAVSNATTYYIYKSSSANGAYSKIGESSYTVYSDSNAPTNGASAYYKVKAVNNAGESTFSDYAKYTSTSNDEAFSPAYTYGNCTVSGNTMTLRWTNSSGYGYGKATEIVLRVWNPYAEEWQDTKLSTTATSTSFNYSTKIDNSGYVKAGIVVSNAKGSFTAGAKIYDTKSKRWLN